PTPRRAPTPSWWARRWSPPAIPPQPSARTAGWPAAPAPSRKEARHEQPRPRAPLRAGGAPRPRTTHLRAALRDRPVLRRLRGALPPRGAGARARRAHRGVREGDRGPG